jgi:hypothetical protein
MKWTDKEIEAMWRTCPDFAPPPAVVMKIATCAVELAAARGGTMVPLEREALLDALPYTDQREAMAGHLAAQGARIAALEARIAADALAAKANIEGWRDTAKDRAATIQSLEQHVSELEKSLENVRSDRDAALTELKATKERLISCETAVETLRAQLPDGMKHCTILFKECAKGHGWLTATNWVPFGCPTCERLTLKADDAAVLMRAVCTSCSRIYRIFKTNGRTCEHCGHAPVEIIPVTDAALLEHVHNVERELELVRKGELCPHEMPFSIIAQEVTKDGELVTAHEVARRTVESLKEHKRALVRARNEGLEKAAAWHDAVARDATEKADWRRSGRHKERSHQQWEWTATCHKEWAKKIRAMKEPES